MQKLTDVNGLLGTRAEKIPKMILRFAPTIEGSPKVERATVEQKLQKPLSENNSAGKYSSKKFSLKKKKRKRRKFDDCSSKNSSLDSFSNGKSDSSDEETSDDRSLNDEGNDKSGNDLGSKSSRHKSHIQDSTGVRIKKLDQKHADRKKLLPRNFHHSKELFYCFSHLKINSHERSFEKTEKGKNLFFVIEIRMGGTNFQSQLSKRDFRFFSMFHPQNEFSREERSSGIYCFPLSAIGVCPKISMKQSSK